MAFRQLFRVLCKKTYPAMACAAASVFVSCEAADKLDNNAKIQWEPPDLTKFTHEYMIKQSTVETVNSVTKTLTIVYIAIESASEEYRQTLSQLMSLIKESLTYNVSDLHWDLILELRLEMQKKQQAVAYLVSYMEYIQKMGVAATEASYRCGLDNLSLTLVQRMDDALNNTTKEINHNLQLEKEYIILQEECVRKKNADETSKKEDKDTSVDIDIDVAD